ncbi:unnamed protein product [Rotaria sp. Silwood2]|nr:unnamed protein product [Rotaria sp. Silwood2]
MTQLDIFTHQLMIIAGIIMGICGPIGNILNICVFTMWSRSRQTTSRYHNNNRTSDSPLYLLTSSIADLIVIVYSLTTRIIFDGYQYKATPNNAFILCKLRYYALHTFDLISLTCLCLATFDRYLISSREVRLQQLSTTRQGTKLVILLLICLIGLHHAF